MGVRDAPLHLLRQLEQVQFLPLPEAEECCGFGGTFSIKQEELSWAMVEDKRRTVEESGAELLVSMDCGCLMHIAGAMAKAGQTIQAMPLAQFLKDRTTGEAGA
jgi:L-lactate dehydrogenase complex protein LldE